jgi:hypothetical protein
MIYLTLSSQWRVPYTPPSVLYMLTALLGFLPATTMLAVLQAIVTPSGTSLSLYLAITDLSSLGFSLLLYLPP